MSQVALLALAANLASVIILLKWRDGDSYVRSVWLCSRNDLLADVGVLSAAMLVGNTGSPWPDWLIGILIASVIMHSAVCIIRDAHKTLKGEEAKVRKVTRRLPVRAGSFTQ